MKTPFGKMYSQLLHHFPKTEFGLSMSNLATILPLNLNVYRNLAAWISDPFCHPQTYPLYSSGRLFGTGNSYKVNISSTRLS